MKQQKFSALVLLIFFLVAGSVLANRQWTPQDEEFDGVPIEGSIRMEVQSLALGHHRFRFTEPSIFMESVELNGRDWTNVDIKGEGRVWQVGAPKLPAIYRTIRLPNTGNVELKIGKIEYDDFPDIDVLPQVTQLEINSQGDAATFEFAFDKELYSSKIPFPELIAMVGEPAIMRDARIAVLAIHPVQYFPAERILRVYRTIELEVLPIGGVGTNEFVGPHRPVPSFASLYRDIIGAGDLVLEAEESLPGQILVIARNATEIRNVLQPWVDWKIASGHPVQVYAPNGSGASASDLLPIIQTAYATWDPPLEFVQLVGDGGTSGNYYLPASDGSISDHGYMRLAGNDILADVSVARWSVETLPQLSTSMNRTIFYERNPHMTDTTWY
ncbi:MAG: C25 family cysteine peptidase, partial [bacterium]|nr:C25 family cysteine peptidase [bacterium]